MSGQCQRLQPLIIDYAVGELNLSDADQVREHLKSCSRCSESLSELQRMVSVFSQQELVEPSAVLCHSVKEAIREELSQPRTPLSVITSAADSLFRRPILAKAAALLAIALMTFLLLTSRTGDRSSTGSGITIGWETREYLANSEWVLRSLHGRRAKDVLGDQDWTIWVGQAMLIREQEALDVQSPLLHDLESLYREILACNGEFGEREVNRIRGIISRKKLIQRTREALQSQR